MAHWIWHNFGIDQAYVTEYENRKSRMEWRYLVMYMPITRRGCEQLAKET